MADERTIMVGGGGYGREIYDSICDCVEAGTLPPVGGYLDDTGDRLAGSGHQISWLGTIADYVPRPGDRFIIAIGTPAGKRIVHQKLQDKGASFARMIHPTARIARTASVGEGVLMGLATVAGPDTFLGRFVSFNAGSGVGHDGRVGEFTQLSANVDITGGAEIGSDVMIGTKVIFLPKVKVGAGATIGAGCVIYRSVPAGATMFAPPARMLRMRR
jgi:sugar O-acyltransferase (sialic acid O-acetyltransferase NeuD family)